ncbi:MAG: sirohydrochlorin cobaltochelatase [Treponema sp.]|jgi:sirohydrochlorin cobaltochelatase|nr:sirohydrochlorin cobaltochelatase [Treponema sp.]
MKHIFKFFCITAALVMIIEATACNTAKPASKDGQKPALLVVSFGTSYNESRAKTIDAVEQALAGAYPDYDQRRAFTSQIIINKLKERDGLTVHTVTEAMKQLEESGIKQVVVQPTLVMNGLEYNDIIAEIKPFAHAFDRIQFGRPLLISDKDYDEFITVITGEAKQYDDGKTAIVFMGHGTEHEANTVYRRLDKQLKDKGFSHYFIGTVEAEPSLDDVIAEVAQLEVQQVVLLPLMIVAGDHAVNDMAGDEEDSWKTVFESKGYRVTPILKGLGEYPGIRQIFVRHVQEALAGSL